MASKTLGPFPKSIRWHEFFPAASSHARDASLAALQERYDSMGDEDAAIRAITFLVALVVCTRARNPWNELKNTFGMVVDGMADFEDIVSALNAYLPEEHPAKTAALRTISCILERDRLTGTLFHNDPWRAWGQFDNRSFCDLARLFYCHLNTECFAGQLADLGINCDPHSLQQFAWEMSLITRSFSARWFHACARYETPDPGSIKWYLGHCLGKVQLELARETSDWVEPTGNPWRRRKIVMPALQFGSQ